MRVYIVRHGERAFTLPGFPTAGVVALDMEERGLGQAEVARHAFPPDYEVIS